MQCLSTNPCSAPSAFSVLPTVLDVLGPMALALTAVGAARAQVVFSLGDIVFFARLAGILLARWIEFAAGEPQTAMGEPAQPQHLRRWAAATAVIGVAIWIGTVLWRTL
jgi:hypothetical protein